MFNETQDVAWNNLAILGESHSLNVNLHGLTIDDAVTLGNQLLGGGHDRPTIKKSEIDNTFIVTARPEEAMIEITIFCLPHLAETPFGTIQASDEVEEEVNRRDGF